MYIRNVQKSLNVTVIMLRNVKAYGLMSQVLITNNLSVFGMMMHTFVKTPSDFPVGQVVSRLLSLRLNNLNNCQLFMLQTKV